MLGYFLDKRSLRKHSKPSKIKAIGVTAPFLHIESTDSLIVSDATRHTIKSYSSTKKHFVVYRVFGHPFRATIQQCDTGICQDINDDVPEPLLVILKHQARCLLYASIGGVSIFSSRVMIINPQCACAGGLRYLSCVCVCVCLSVCYHSSSNIGRFYAENEVCRGLS